MNTVLLATTASIAVTHTLIGIDHYIPFIAMSHANRWTLKKTMLIVFVCGLGHVLSSVLLGFLGILLSESIERLVHIETARAGMATWFLVGFGAVYTVYGVWKAYKNKPHRHVLSDGETLVHQHGGDREHVHKKLSASPNAVWGLFVLFVLGPCEPLIPLIMYPAAAENALSLWSVVVCFSVLTIGVMMLTTLLGVKGLSFLKVGRLERYSGALAGFAILACGVMLVLFDI
ncbi:MAG: hypothetical protein FWF05_03345 [Oscillospiraceae bacterium]|nr:hypothetical protein [Oscillospiraceae bacterium]